jgi:hypothetical protein
MADTKPKCDKRWVRFWKIWDYAKREGCFKSYVHPTVKVGYVSSVKEQWSEIFR